MCFPTDHQAVATGQSVDASAGTAIEVVDALVLKGCCTLTAVLEVGVAVINDDVSLLET